MQLDTTNSSRAGVFSDPDVPNATPTPDLPETQRRSIFLALVAAQDLGIAVRPSRALVAKEQEVTIEQVEVIEREGMDQLWPPLEK